MDMYLLKKTNFGADLFIEDQYIKVKYSKKNDNELDNKKKEYLNSIVNDLFQRTCTSLDKVVNIISKASALVIYIKIPGVGNNTTYKDLLDYKMGEGKEEGDFLIAKELEDKILKEIKKIVKQTIILSLDKVNDKSKFLKDIENLLKKKGIDIEIKQESEKERDQLSIPDVKIDEDIGKT